MHADEAQDPDGIGFFILCDGVVLGPVDIQAR
jgi:hypothetical protein